GTELARRWRAEEYRPWSLERTVDELSFALLRLNLADIPVIRLGLAPEAELLPNILAGPWHPALGNMVQGRALFRWIEEQVRRLPAPLARLTLPGRLQGLFWGHKGELESEYQAISIPKSKVTFWDRPIVKFTTSDYN
ncbi:MAG: radical SAM protein, partial [Desulfovibrionaceae bacterium]|nr:radical SAM protein [Desulfovibrionaceae bacterium]